MADKYKPSQIIKALNETKGMVYIAARRVGCDPKTIHAYAKKYPGVKEALETQRGEVTDTAELALLKAIQSGEAWAVCFYLKTQGKDRGYVERQEVTGKDGGAVQVADATSIAREIMKQGK